ncbi:hypothetical protein HanRHA438_Chr01g0006011 [Helianthus annuus]|nr:hypothetical protein HanRHA438_Chr01g0006011 [Helianthus annuus]
MINSIHMLTTDLGAWGTLKPAHNMQKLRLKSGSASCFADTMNLSSMSPRALRPR